MATSNECCVETHFPPWEVTGVKWHFMCQSQKASTEVDLILLDNLILETYMKFAWKNSFLEPPAC